MRYDDQDSVELRGMFASYRILFASQVPLDRRAAAEHPAFVCMDLDRWLDDSMASRRLLDLAARLGACGLSSLSMPNVREELGRAIRRAFDDGTLVAFAETESPHATGAGRGTEASKPAEPKVSEDQPAAPAPAFALTWIEIELLDSNSVPVAGARYTITLPDFSDRKGTLGDDGRARLDDIEAGICGVVFHDYAAEDWGAQGREGGSVYTVVQGDCLSSIAARFGFGDWRTIYHAPQNEGFRANRPDPNVIFPGDQLFIPTPEAEPVERATGARHTFQLRTTAPRLRVRLLMGFPFPVTHLYRLTVDGAEHEGSVAEGEVIDVPIRPDTASGQMWVWPQLGYPLEPFEWTFRLGQLDPANELSGVQARLNNLGFRCGTVDGIMGPKTSAALMLFQCARAIAATGTLDDGTREALRVTHDAL